LSGFQLVGGALVSGAVVLATRARAGGRPAAPARVPAAAEAA